MNKISTTGYLQMEPIPNNADNFLKQQYRSLPQEAEQAQTKTPEVTLQARLAAEAVSLNSELVDVLLKRLEHVVRVEPEKSEPCGDATKATHIPTVATWFRDINWRVSESNSRIMHIMDVLEV